MKYVTIDHRSAKWPPVYVVTDLLDCIGHISDIVVEQIARAGPLTDDIGDLQLNDDYISTSGILDTNNISQSANAATLHRLSCLLDDDTVNVIYASNLKSWACVFSRFPTLFLMAQGNTLMVVDPNNSH